MGFFGTVIASALGTYVAISLGCLTALVISLVRKQIMAKKIKKNLDKILERR